jgi:predicted dehydrogenase
VTVNVALVGLGYWGPNLARNLVLLDGGRLHTICDSRPDQLARYAAQYPQARATGDLATVIADEGVDAIVLATPIETHHRLARMALDAGKHVLVEKPLAATSEQCRDLIDVAASRGLTLMVGHVFLYNSAVRKVKEYISSGELGDPMYVYSQRLNLGQVRHDVNALWNFAPHDLSIIGYWLDAEPRQVVARGFDFIQPGIEDVVFMTLDYPGGVGANVHISWLDPMKVRRMTVVGSEKMVVYDDVSADARIMLYDKGVTRASRHPEAVASAPIGRFETFGEFQLLLRAGDVLIPKLDFIEPLRVETQHFVDCILSGDQPLSDGSDGLRVVLALEAAQRSMDETRARALAGSRAAHE